MNIFQKKLSINPKKLNIREVWQVYSLIKGGLPKQHEKYLLHEVLKIIQGISTKDFKDVLMIMGAKESDLRDPIKASLLFVDGLKQNEFFSFTQFMMGIYGN